MVLEHWMFNAGDAAHRYAERLVGFLFLVECQRELCSHLLEVDAVVLEQTKRLTEAYIYSVEPQLALTRALEQAQEHIQIAWSMLPNTKPFSREQLNLSENLAEDARSTRNYLREKIES